MAPAAPLVLTGVLLGFPLCASGVTTLSAGTEYLQWREYHPLPILEETGFRPFIQLEGSSGLSPRVNAALAGRFYGGAVVYNGQLMDGTPLEATTGYAGMAGEAGVDYRLHGSPDDGLSLLFRAGIDQWERDLRGRSGYREEYRFVYLRVGLQEEAPPGRWLARGGLLWPLFVREQVNLGGGFRLEPKGRPSLYAEFGRRLGAAWEAGVGFRRYRFDASDAVAVDIDGDGIRERVFQPASDADVYSIYARLGF